MARFVCVDAETFEVGRAAWPRHHFSHIFGNIVDFPIKKIKKYVLWGILVFYGVSKKGELHFAAREHCRPFEPMEQC